MSACENFRYESSQFISALLVKTLGNARVGFFDSIEDIGLSIDSLRILESLKPDQITRVAANYCAMGKSLEDWFPIDATRISKLLEVEASESEQHAMIDEMLMRGACRNLMKEFFGFRTTQVAMRKRILGIPTVRGRLMVPTHEQQCLIYEEWLNLIEVTDIRRRLLEVARRTNLPLSMIFREIKEIEQVMNHSRYSDSIAARTRNLQNTKGQNLQVAF